MTEAELLAALPILAFQAVLLLARLGSAAMLLPGLGEAEVPATVRLAFALALVALVLPTVADQLPLPPDSLGGWVRLLALETLAGLWLGGLARLVMLALAVGGQLIALVVGLTSVLAPDAQLGQAAPTGRLLALAGTVLVLATGLYAVPLRGLVDSYAVLPAGAPWPAGEAAEAWAAAVGECVAIALRLAAPFVLGAVILNLGLGLLARIAPQVQVYFVAAPGQLLAGIALLALLLPPLLGAFGQAARAGFARLPGVG